MSQLDTREPALGFLQRRLHPGDTVYLICRHVGIRGTVRYFSVFQCGPDPWAGESLADITWATAQVLGAQRGPLHGGAIRMRGTDSTTGVAQHLVSELGNRLFPTGYPCLGRRCPSKEHQQPPTVEDWGHHDDSEYALRVRLL